MRVASSTVKVSMKSGPASSSAPLTTAAMSTAHSVVSRTASVSAARRPAPTARPTRASAEKARPSRKYEPIETKCINTALAASTTSP